VSLTGHLQIIWMENSSAHIERLLSIQTLPSSLRNAKTTSIMISSKAYAALDSKTPLQPYNLSRRSVGPNDVHIEILYCGVCHSDLHQARNEWGGSLYPMVPGHEIVGRVVEAGSQVSRFKAGDIAAVGVIVDSCRHCNPCKQDLEQYCIEAPTVTYNGYERDGKTLSQGGYSTNIVTNQHFVLRVDPGSDLKAVAPLLCAGITTWSPLRHLKVGKGMRVAVAGLGGLGHMGLKFAVSLGAEVTLISTSPEKEKDARRLGAHNFINVKDSAALKKFNSYFDVILNTISAPHDYKTYLDLLTLNGTMAIVGLPPEAQSVSPFSLLTNRRSIMGSCIGGIKETQEMLDYCAANNIVSDVEVIPMQQINEAFERMQKGDVRYRFVIDLASLKS
jgi:uncharacterized zinc-type alcohol dehydrogenase-like protein